MWGAWPIVSAQWILAVIICTTTCRHHYRYLQAVMKMEVSISTCSNSARIFSVSMSVDLMMRSAFIGQKLFSDPFQILGFVNYKTSSASPSLGNSTQLFCSNHCLQSPTPISSSHRVPSPLIWLGLSVPEDHLLYTAFFTPLPPLPLPASHSYSSWGCSMFLGVLRWDPLQRPRRLLSLSLVGRATGAEKL